jgi:hypothetical protein
MGRTLGARPDPNFSREFVRLGAHVSSRSVPSPLSSNLVTAFSSDAAKALHQARRAGRPTKDGPVRFPAP